MDFQTPPIICDYMVSFLPNGDCGKILEPTPGMGNLVKAAEGKGIIIAPQNFFDLDFNERYDWILMNPPFSPMSVGYDILYKCMDMSDNIIALMPWLTLINGEKRSRDISEFGLKSITNLPRKVFKGSRVQCCILEMNKGYKGNTIYKNLQI